MILIRIARPRFVLLYLIFIPAAAEERPEVAFGAMGAWKEHPDWPPKGTISPALTGRTFPRSRKS